MDLMAGFWRMQVAEQAGEEDQVKKFSRYNYPTMSRTQASPPSTPSLSMTILFTLGRTAHKLQFSLFCVASVTCALVVIVGCHHCAARQAQTYNQLASSQHVAVSLHVTSYILCEHPSDMP